MRVLIISDISLVGNASALVANSILNHQGIETAILPVAVLSSQTGGVKDYSYYDFSQNFEEILAKWNKLDLKFDAIYTGYLGTSEAIEKTISIVKNFKEKVVKIFVDPVLGDFGKLYDGFTEDMPEKMKDLVALADVIFPNFTEWNLLVQGRSCNLAPITIITGKNAENGTLRNVLLYDEKTMFFETSRSDGDFHCAGDTFASVFISYYLRGYTLENSVEKSTQFVEKCIKYSVENSLDRRLGLPFTQFLKTLD